jgi:hypothetical protein
MRSLQEIDNQMRWNMADNDDVFFCSRNDEFYNPGCTGDATGRFKASNPEAMSARALLMISHGLTV